MAFLDRVIEASQAFGGTNYADMGVIDFAGAPTTARENAAMASTIAAMVTNKRRTEPAPADTGRDSEDGGSGGLLDTVFGGIGAGMDAIGGAVSDAGDMFASVKYPGSGAINEGVGAVTGTVKSFAGDVIEGAEIVGREFIREPISTAMIAGSLTDSPTYGQQGGSTGFLGFLDPSTWRDAHRLAQDTSVGQSFSLAFGTKDILDPEEVNNYVGTSWFRYSSGTVDALFRFFLDVDVLLAKGPSAIRTYRGLRALEEGGSAARVTGRLGEFALWEPPQIARRATDLGRVRPGGRIDRLNNILRNTWVDLPEPMRVLVGTQRIAGPGDVPRLTTGLEAATTSAEARRMLAMADTYDRAGDLTRASAMRNIAASKEVRATRLSTGAMTGAYADASAAALRTDLDEYFNLAQRRNLLGGRFQTRDWTRLNQTLDDIPVDERAGWLRDVMFPTHHRGDIISHFLAEATSPLEREHLLRLFMGDNTQLAKIRESNYALGQRLEDLGTEEAGIFSHPVFQLEGTGAEGLAPSGEYQTMLDYATGGQMSQAVAPTRTPLTTDDMVPSRDLASQSVGSGEPHQLADYGRTPPGTDVDFDLANHGARLERIGEEIDEVVAQRDRNMRMIAGYNTLDQVPHLRPTRAAIHGSNLWQGSWAGNAVRVFTDMRPRHIVDIADSGADAQLARVLREAGVDDQTIYRTRGRFMALPSENRAGFFQGEIDQQVRRLAKTYGMSTEDVAVVLENARVSTNRTSSLLRSAKYDAENRALVRMKTEEGIVEQPLYVTQLDNAVPVPDFRRMRRDFERYAKANYGSDWQRAIARGARPAHTAVEWGGIFADSLMHVWKPSVLLRPAWTVRVVLMDEQLRQLANFGAMASFLGRRQDLHNYMAAMRASYPKLNSYLGEFGKPNMWRRSLTGATIGAGIGGSGRAFAGLITGGPMTAMSEGVAGALGGAIVGGGAGAASAVASRILRNLSKLENAGVENFRVGPWAIDPPYGQPGAKEEIYRDLVSASRDTEELFDAHRTAIMRGLRRNPDSWRTYGWDIGAGTSKNNQLYRQEWQGIMGRHFVQDEMARLFVAGKTPAEVAQWLERSPAGRTYASRIPYRWDKKAWADSAFSQFHAYTGGSNPEVLRELQRVGETTSAQEWNRILDLIPETQRPLIHGAEFDQVMGRGPIARGLNTFVQHAYRVMGTMATDELSRSPTFVMYYQAEMRRMLGTQRPMLIQANELKAMENSARAFALGETRDLLYDMAERSRFADMTRLLMPFYPAWQEVLTRWAGLAAEKPWIVPRAMDVFNAPERAGWTTTDDQGQTFLNFRIPGFARALIGTMFDTALDAQGNVKFDRDGFNLVAQGTPGFGPFAQYAASEMVRRNPTLEDSVKFIIPFGPTEGLVETFLPPQVKRAWATAQGEESAAAMNARAQIAKTYLTEMETGQRPMMDLTDPVQRQAFMDQVERDANNFMSLRIFAGMVAPVAPLFESPYQPYIDVYRALRARDFTRAKEIASTIKGADEDLIPGSSENFTAETADNVFIQLFGQEYFYVTQAATQTVNGVPPTIEGYEAQEQFGDLITRYGSDWGGVIVGTEAGGEAAQFSRAMYDRQLASGERKRLSLEEIVTEPEVRLGWQKYSRYMDLIEAARVQMNLPNMRVAGAENLRTLKDALVMSLAKRYPLWFQEFSVTDRGAWKRKMEGAYAMVESPDLANRPDISGLATYLRQREGILAILSTRESQDLTAVGNADIAMLWDSMRSKLVEENPAFADLYYRKLEQDPLDPDTARGTLSPRPQAA